MGKKKEKYVPIVLCGSFFDVDDVKEAFSLPEEVCVEDVTEKFKEFFLGIDFNEYPNFMKNMVLIHSDKILYEDTDEIKGYYVGIPFFDVPEQFSIKRVCLDVRNLFVNSGFLPDDIDPDFIKVFAKILKVD